MSRDLAAQFQREQLHSAAAAGDLARVDDLLRRGYRPNRFDDLGRTPLHYAVEHGHLTVVKRLIRAGANVNAHDERMIGNTPLAVVPEPATLPVVGVAASGLLRRRRSCACPR